MRRMLRLASVVPVLFLLGCGGSDKPVNEVEGGELVVDLSADEMKSALILKKAILADYDKPVYGYKAYKIPYTTTDEEGNSVGVSGLMVVPTGLPDVVYSTYGLSVVSDSHGTIFANAEAPTEIASITHLADGAPALFTSLGGFVTLQADYIGFGDSTDHYHPYVLKNSLANATIDFINAVKVFASNNDINLNGQLFLTGYSEGGYSAMATLQKIEAETDLQVTLALPMAGPYAVESLIKIVLSEDTISVPSYMANLAYSYSLAYDIDVATGVNEPYASSLEALLDGSKTGTEVDAALTATVTGPEGLFRSDFVEGVLNEVDHWFNTAARANDVHDWVPQTEVRLVHCLGDDVIPYNMSELTKETMLTMSNGTAKVSIVTVEAVMTQNPLTEVRYGHTECGPIAYSLVTGLLAETRKSTIGY